MIHDDLFFSLANASPIGIYLVQQRVFRYVNPEFCSITGYRPEELLGRNCLSFVVESDRRRVKQSAIDMLKGRARRPYDYRVTCKDGSNKWILETVASVDYEGLAVVGNFMDITERKLAEIEIAEEARRDSLTRLLNHGAFLEELYASITSNAEVAHWLVMADVDGLKQINDNCGHQMGDLILRKVAAVMDRPNTTVARFGGDEFVAMLAGGTRQRAIDYCIAIKEILEQSPLTDSRTKSLVSPKVSLGIAGYPDDATSATALIRAADDAMYQHKAFRPHDNCAA